MDNEKSIRAAKLTLGGLLEKRRAGEAKDRAPGQIAPSKYLPGVPRAVHANGGRVYPLDERSGWYGDANYQQTGGKMVMMSPDEYLSKVRPLDIDEGSRDNIEDLKNHILSGRKLDPLKIDAKGREDGRHRAHAARELGIKSVPVLTWPGDNIAKANGGPVTDNDNFQSWFGNSVTHTDGQPHVFYTGTSKDKDFTSFNVGRHGAWFTRDPEVASQYADANDSQGYKQDGWNMVKTNTASRVIPAYVKAENPYTGELPQEYMRDNYKAAQSDWFDKLRRMGHDAWMPSSQGGNLVVALKEPQQIKSIYNKGTFDPGQKHMNKADGGRIGYEDGGAVGGTEPKNTVKAYKLFRTKGDGKLYPLFVNAEKPVPFGQWLEAEEGPQGKAEGKVKSKLGDLAYRPGWHAGDLPVATHIGGKSDPSLKKPDYRPDNHIWAEVEMAADKDWQSVANSRGKGVKAHITDQVPYGGFYRYKTNPNMTGNWLIGGNMKVNRVLSDEEVKAINDAAGTADLPRMPDIAKADGGAVTTETKDGSGIFGNGALIHRYTHPETGGYIDVLQRPQGPASVLGLEVPEEHRGKGIGQMLQAKALEKHPALMGQVSSKAAATTAYRLGRRPYGAPDATLDDVFSNIDSDSSVNMLSPQAQPKADGGAAGSDMFQGIHPTVRDEQGAPMDLYHGTPGEPFNAFDDKKPGERDAGFFGKGHYLTPIKGNAEGYADPDEMGKGSVMGPLHAALKNPYVWDTSSDAAAHRTLRDLQSMGIMRDKQELNSWDNLQRHHMDTFMGEMKKRGHDGVVVRTKSYDERPHNTTEIVVFKPSDIKHKDAEVFDPNDPNIYRAAGGVAK